MADKVVKGFFNPDAMVRAKKNGIKVDDRRVDWEVDNESKVPASLKAPSKELINAKLNNPEYPEYRGKIDGITIKA